MKECEKFEELVANRKFKYELLALTSLLEPFSIILHYYEGDSVPVLYMSHIFILVTNMFMTLRKIYTSTRGLLASFLIPTTTSMR